MRARYITLIKRVSIHGHTEHILNGKSVVELVHKESATMTTPIVNRLHFYHDAQGQVALVDFNGTKYSYARNLQGDIIGIRQQR